MDMDKKICLRCDRPLEAKLGIDMGRSASVIATVWVCRHCDLMEDVSAQEGQDREVPDL